MSIFSFGALRDSISSYRFFILSSDTLDFDVIILPIDRRFEYPPHVYGYSPLFFGNVLFSKPYTSGEKDGRGPCGAESTINILSAENERNRIGRDLHDTLGHTFAMMSLKTELALKQMDKEQYDAARKNLEELNQISRDSMYEVREIVNKLKYRTVAEELLNSSDSLTYRISSWPWIVALT